MVFLLGMGVVELPVSLLVYGSGAIEGYRGQRGERMWGAETSEGGVRQVEV